MNTTLCWCVGGLALLAAPAAVEAKGITYDCDTAANHFSGLSLPVDGVAFTDSGKVQLNTLAESRTYVTLARDQITSSTTPGKSPDVYAGLALKALPADAKKTPSGSPAVQMLSYSANGKEDEILPLSLMTKPGTVQPFSLSYDGDKVLVSLGAETRSSPFQNR